MNYEARLYIVRYTYILYIYDLKFVMAWTQ